jgi:hypothetical protein
MVDIVERLRLNKGEIFGPTMQEAADEIERLRTQLAAAQKDAERYRKLRALKNYKYTTIPSVVIFAPTPDLFDAEVDKLKPSMQEQT